MSGGTHEFTMSNMVSPDGSIMMSGYSSSSHSGYSGIIYDEGNYTSYVGTYSYPEEKYYDKYSFGTSISNEVRGKLGDATKEVYFGSNYGWYGGNTGFVNHAYPWIVRGGSYTNSNSSLFYYTNSTGFATSNLSSRLIIN